MSLKLRSIIYLLLFSIVMLTTAYSVNIWRELDWNVYRMLMGTHLPALGDEIVLIDLPYQNNLAMFRNNQAQLLNQLADQGQNLPRAVVLDIAFTADDTGAAAIRRAMETLIRQQVPVYASFNPEDANRPLYSGLSGYGHTVFNQITGTFFYDTLLAANDPVVFPRSKAKPGEELEALPVRMAVDFRKLPMKNRSERHLVYVGNPEEIKTRTLTFEPNNSGGKLVQPNGSNPLSLRGKTVIVGSLAFDRHKAANGLSGPVLVAWAISDLLYSSASAQPPAILSQPWVLILMTVGFGLLTVVLFIVQFRLYHRLHGRLWFLFCSSVSGSLLLLAAIVAGLRVTGTIYPQVTLVVIAIFLSAGFSWHYYRKYLFQRSYLRDLNVAPDHDRNEYDIFISYSHTPAENIMWVENNLVEPLRNIIKIDGSPLRVFFDKDRIHVGNAWFRKLAQCIEGSRYFIAVYDNNYFGKDFCYYEMENAAIKRVSKRDFILAVEREVPNKIPVEFKNIHYIKVSTDFINDLIKQMPDIIAPPL